MKTLYTSLLLTVLLISGINHQSSACYANFTHTNACVGDTVWFYALDLSAVHSWDFGDSISGNPNTAYDDTVFHIYTTPGTYYVTHFDNIGAEWAFETQVITVSATCFAAAFNAQCGGSLSFNFTNQSIGNNLTYQWTFGEPSSGVNDTSNLLNPYHAYTIAGAYTVTLIISDGTQADTTSQIINVSANCMSFYISYMLNPCANDTTHFYYNFSGVTGVLWNFGDPSSGAANTSTDFVPYHIFSTPGVYVGSVIYSDGINTDTLTVITNIVDCNVFPGDANRNGRVEGEDILAIALYYGDTGIARSGASLNFTPQACTDWGTTLSTFTGNMYLNDMVNLKNADCNGDGVINDLDVQAITQNFGMVSQPHNIESQMQMVPNQAPMLKVTLLDTTLIPCGNPATAILSLGELGDTVKSIYGICARIKYNDFPIIPNSFTVDFSNSWLDTSGLPNLIYKYYNDEVNHLLTIVAARKNHLAIDGSGEIAVIHFDLGCAMKLERWLAPVSLSILPDAKVLNNSVFYPNGNFGYVQHFINVNIESDSTMVDVGDNINEISINNNLTLYPSPATNQLFISSKENIRDAQLKVFDAAGKLLFENNMSGMNSSIDVKNFAAGVYLLEVTAGLNIFRNKFVKQ
ncbi:MAG: T9SS C-terminal target domain-containing protein [Sphingobacteriales bacterium]|nr:MAG: T9SS C-terminal target domain-containing protein [Sphingobacteriales bacterium]